MEEGLARCSIKLALFLRSMRKDRNWTQEQLSEVSGIDYKHIQRLESTKQKNDLRFSTLLKLSTAFGMSLPEIVEQIVSEKGNDVYSSEDYTDSWGEVAEKQSTYEP